MEKLKLEEVKQSPTFNLVAHTGASCQGFSSHVHQEGHFRKQHWPGHPKTSQRPVSTLTRINRKIPDFFISSSIKIILTPFNIQSYEGSAITVFYKFQSSIYKCEVLLSNGPVIHRLSRASSFFHHPHIN